MNNLMIHNVAIEKILLLKNGGEISQCKNEQNEYYLVLKIILNDLEIDLFSEYSNNKIIDKIK